MIAIALPKNIYVFVFFQEKKTKKTEVIKKNNYPQYQESFNFKLEEEELETHGVKISSIQKVAFPEKGKLDQLRPV